jgi:hypothetical protein
MVNCTMVASYGAVLPLQAFFLSREEQEEDPLERSKCPSPSSSLDDITDDSFFANHPIWADADRLVLSLLQDSQQSLLDLEDDDDEEEKEGDFFFLDHLPRPIPVHPARVVSHLVAVVTPAATNTTPTTTGLARSQSAVW